MHQAFHPLVLFAVAVGGALGALTRHATGALLAARDLASWQATLGVNVAGSLVIGVLAAAAASGELSPQWIWRATLHGDYAAVWRAALITGFLGSLTTFSTFSLDTFQFVRQERIAAAAAYAIGSLSLGLAAAALGWQLYKTIRNG